MKGNISKLIFIVFLYVSCSREGQSLFNPDAERNPPQISTNVVFADPNLVKEAKDLHRKLQMLTQRGIAFGQHRAIAGGVNSFESEPTIDSDFSMVANDFPAIIGFDLEELELVTPLNPNEFVTDFKKEIITKAHQNGSIITISWHASNPISGGNSFDRTRVVAQMLKGGSQRETFIKYLERLSVFLNSLKDSNGKPIPVLFRPWHEMNGDFFYWGEGLRSTEEYKQLFRDTVQILSEKFNVHNLLYIYSPNWVSSRSEYLRNYPGDEYVDMLGIDVYDFENGSFLQNALGNLKIVEDIATDKNMLFSLTETGLLKVTQNDWWTESLYKAIRSSGITYAMIWSNATTEEFFGPFVGHPSEENFKEFISKDIILLNSDIQ